MRYAKWNGGEYDREAAACLQRAGYPGLLSAVLASRSIDEEQAHALLMRDQLHLHDPFLMRDMDKAVARVQQAL